MSASPTVAEQMEHLTRGCEHVLTAPRAFVLSVGPRRHRRLLTRKK